MLCNDLVQAQHHLEQSLTVSQASSDRRGAAWALNDLGYLAMVCGETNQARVFLEEAVSELRDQGIPFGTFSALIALGDTLRLLDDHGRARVFYREALHIQQQMHYVLYVNEGLDGLAGIAAAEGDSVRAARLFGAAHAHCEVIATPHRHNTDAIYDRDLALAGSLLDPEAWDAAWTAGYAMSLDEAVAYALTEGAEPNEHPSDGGEPIPRYLSNC
jgi:tetratricopeptide (TPR) repeat protein